MRASVVIASHERPAQIEACLDALAAQAGPSHEAEVIVVDSGPATETAGLIAARHDWVELVRSQERLGPHEARNLGASKASGEVIVFTDADCVASPGWIEGLLAEHAAGAELVGGGIDPGHAGIVERGANMCKFALWLEGLPPGHRRTYPTANLSLTRELWDRVGPFRVGGWSGDTELVWRARSEGAREAFAPAAAVTHTDPVALAEFVRERRERGRAFASLRVTARHWSRLHSAAYAAASPLIALWLIARGLALGIRSGRPLAALATAPVQALGFGGWAAGEASAYARHAAGKLGGA